MASLKIGTFNVGGIHSPAKRKKILIYLTKLKLDVAMLQETHLLPPEVAKLGTLGWKVMASASYNSKARGVSILVRTSRDVTVHTTVMDPQGRFVIVDATIDKSRLLLCNIYAPNTNSSDFFLRLLNKLYAYGTTPLILGGDYNIVSSPRLDRSQMCGRKHKTQKIGIPYILNKLHLVDSWRILHPVERDYTCLSAAHGTLSRIDYMLISDSLFPRLLETGIEPILISDHALCLYQSEVTI